MHRNKTRARVKFNRVFILRAGLIFISIIVVFRLFTLQIIDGSFYQALASGQHSFYQDLFADRGHIWVRDWVDGSEYKVATNVPSHFVYAEPVHLEDPLQTTIELSKIFGYPIPPDDELGLEVLNARQTNDDFINILEIEEDDQIEQDNFLNFDNLADIDAESENEENREGEIVEEENIVEENKVDEYRDFRILLARLSKENDPYEPVRRNVNDATLDKIKELNIRGIRWLTETARAYPESGIGGHILGFVGRNANNDRVGQYGIEGSFEQFLAGQDGFLHRSSDPSGRWINNGFRSMQSAVNGGDLLLTIDRTVQFITCDAIKRGVERFQADMGTVVILEPSTGRVMAMCSWPDFQPENYGFVENISIYNNPAIAHSYEPGSVFKSLVMASAIDEGVITPNTLFNDTGEEKIDRFTIRNSDGRAHGLQSMTYILDNSLNTGMIDVMRRMGMESFKRYMNLFNFGRTTGIELPGEASGNFNTLNRLSEIYFATASYGQGITVTPLQIAQAYATLANDGLLMKPYIVEERRHDSGFVEKTIPQPLHQVISKRAATTIGGMLVSVVEGPHGTNAKVDGYYMAGKTGTAQVASDTGGYSLNHTKATFAGYGPVDNPQFAMVVMLDKPRTSPWASSTSAIIWSDIAEFLMRYLEVIPQR